MNVSEVILTDAFSIWEKCKVDFPCLGFMILVWSIGPVAILVSIWYALRKHFQNPREHPLANKWRRVFGLTSVLFLAGWTVDAFSFNVLSEMISTISIDLVTVGIIYCLICFWEITTGDFRYKERINLLEKIYVAFVIAVSIVTNILAYHNDLKVYRAGFYLALAVFFLTCPTLVLHLCSRCVGQSDASLRKSRIFFAVVFFACLAASGTQLFATITVIQNAGDGFLDSNLPENKHFSFILGTLQGIAFVIGIYISKKVEGRKEIPTQATQTQATQIQELIKSPRPEDEARRGLLEGTEDGYRREPEETISPTTEDSTDEALVSTPPADPKDQ